MIHTSDSLRSQDGDFENYHYQLEDGVFPKAVCLSDDTVLQSIFFYSAYEVA